MRAPTAEHEAISRNETARARTYDVNVEDGQQGGLQEIVVHRVGGV